MPGLFQGSQATVLETQASSNLLRPPWTQLDTFWSHLGAGKVSRLIPGHLALLDRVLEVLAGTAPSFSHICGMFPRSVGNSGAANVASKEAAKESPRTSKRPRESQGFLERPKASQDPERPRASQSVPERPTASHL